MKRNVIAILTAAGVSLAAPVAAQDQAAECDIQAGIVMTVVDSRTAGRDAEATVNTVQSDLSGEAAKYASVVPAVVDWVYTLPEDQLGPAVGESWVEACRAR